MTNYMSNGKVMIAHLITGLIKKLNQISVIPWIAIPLNKNESIFSKIIWTICGDINVRVDLSNYATKKDIKNISHFDTSSFALKASLASLKSEADTLDIDKLAPTPVDLSKISNVVEMMLLKNCI